MAEAARIPTWGIIMMLLASALGVVLLALELKRRYRKRWPW